MTKNKKLLKRKLISFLKKEYKKSGIVPSGRKIYDRFGISVWSDFKGGLNEVYKLCGFNFSPQENKQTSRKKFYLLKRNKKRKEIIEYFLQQIRKNKKLTVKIIQKKFSIELTTYFPDGIKELYKIAKTDPPVRLRDKKNLQKAIIRYIQSQVKNGFYPTYDEIREKFQTNIRNSMSIRKLYQLARVKYKRDPNPFLRYKKERILAQITKKIFSKLGYKIKGISIGPSKPKGPDLIIEDKEKRLIPVEIKAYQKFGKIGSGKNSLSYFRNEILQVKRYIKNRCHKM